MICAKWHSNASPWGRLHCGQVVKAHGAKRLIGIRDLPPQASPKLCAKRHRPPEFEWRTARATDATNPARRT